MNKITRRQALAGTTAGALTALGVAATAANATPATTPTTSGTATEEVYQGRRIRITQDGGGHHGGHHGAGLPTVRIDGRELHVMRNADGTWISVVNHYETFADPLSLARAAVRDLQGSELAPFGGAA
ncbi:MULTISPECIES: tyrosinase family oxidase copper chaperone [unclassified Streptomyces]|uniref:apotyrosinase chaperone MelC1 n=1 Tax=unclassified Streptomyces TaxID=2593676 RepID=UPI003647A305